MLTKKRGKKRKNLDAQFWCAIITHWISLLWPLPAPKRRENFNLQPSGKELSKQQFLANFVLRIRPPTINWRVSSIFVRHFQEWSVDFLILMIFPVVLDCKILTLTLILTFDFGRSGSYFCRTGRARPVWLSTMFLLRNPRSTRSSTRYF